MDDGIELGDGDTAAEDVRDRILAAALALLAREGRDALTTRAVAAAAGTQAPTLYRLFGDKQGLVEAVAEHGFAAYLRQKRPPDPGGDPVAGLRAGWDLHVGFGLANPGLYAAMYGEPRPGRTAPAAARAEAMLHEQMRALARAGRLRVDEARAAGMVHAAASGVVFSLLAAPEAARDPGLSPATREAVIAAITADAPPGDRGGLIPAATTLRALLPEAGGLSPGERLVLAEWLDRLARPASGSA